MQGLTILGYSGHGFVGHLPFQRLTARLVLLKLTREIVLLNLY